MPAGATPRQYGSLPLNDAVEDLFRKACDKELRQAMRQTARAREFLAATRGATERKISSNPEDVKSFAEFESGEKLQEMITFADKAEQNLGRGFIDKNLVKEAKAQAKDVLQDQQKNREALFALIRPALPYIGIGLAGSAVNCLLRGNFHAIGHWGHCCELAAEGRMAEAVSAVHITFLLSFL